MRLLDTTTLELKEFFDNHELPSSERGQISSNVGNITIPDYAALSHTCGLEEIPCLDMRGDKTLTKLKGRFLKVKDSCHQAFQDEHQYIWIDTCCIDKSSSTELLEAINSMYQLCKNSKVCYVYLPVVDETNMFRRYSGRDVSTLAGSLGAGRYKSRLLPQMFNFYSREWITLKGRRLGTYKDRKSVV